jgi:imidazolonepropionase-like amidohydrolase
MLHALLSLALLARSPQDPAPAARATSVVAFVDVDVVPMDREIVLRDQTVIVRDDRIAEIGPAKDVKVPDGAFRIAGREGGKTRTLMPGLADMHVHAWSPDDLVLFVANGVTTVRNMFGSPMHLDWRAKIASGESFGPAIYTAGPIIDGDPPVWPGSTVLVDPSKAESVVVEEQQAGYDFLKVYARLSLPCYDALVESARKHGMRVMGHVPSAVGLAHVIESKQDSVEHLDGLAAIAQQDGSPFKGKVDFRDEAAAWKHVDDSKIAETARTMAKNGVWSCPTLVVLQKWVPKDEAQALFDRPEMRYVPAVERMFWQPGSNYLARMSDESIRAVQDADVDRKRATGILHKAGARILLGTDMGNPFVIAGFAVHEELRNLVASGLSSYEALRAGTSGAAEFMKAGAEWGTVAKGRRADLLLLEGNPLDDVGNAARRVGVMIRGAWCTEAELHARLEDLATANGSGKTDPAKPEGTPK